MPDEIVLAATDADFERFAELIREYWGWLLDRYATQPGLMESIASEQGLDKELHNLRSAYGSPAGRTFLAVSDGSVVGAVAFHDLGDGTCEMKRLFIQDRAQGRGLGRRLTVAVIDSARADGYSVLRLDTGFLNSEAMRMYEKLGFEYSGPYRDYPPGILPHLKFMQLDLAEAGATYQR